MGVRLIFNGAEKVGKIVDGEIESGADCQNAFGNPACFSTSFAVCRLFERGTMTTRILSALTHFS
jgi:hypothetical protein